MTRTHVTSSPPLVEGFCVRHEAMLAGLHFSTTLLVSTKHASLVEVERGIWDYPSDF